MNLELQEVCAVEAAVIDGGWGSGLGFYARYVRDYAMKEWGYSPQEATELAVSMSPEEAA